ncbi:swi5-like zinc finger protein [Coemansia sp. Benny D115]|nr:swi5-like zinc finger protein [Coemansia sp. Benny D115]
MEPPTPNDSIAKDSSSSSSNDALAKDPAAPQTAEQVPSPLDDRKRELEASIEQLRSELASQTAERDAALAKSGLTVDEARKITDELIDRLHRYNDIKDAGQILFGKLAELRGKTVKDIYAEYGVNLED